MDGAQRYSIKLIDRLILLSWLDIRVNIYFSATIIIIHKASIQELVMVIT